MKLVIGGIKGGTGKTTLATNLAYMRATSGKRVLLVDTDKQRSASLWVDQRIGMSLQTNWTTVQLSGMYLFNEIQKLADNYDDIIIDAGGYDNPSQRSALTIADVFLMPFRPKAFDIWTLGAVRNLLCELIPANPRLKPLAVLNQSDPNSQADILEAQEIISECKELVCLPITIGSRKAFGNAATEGLAVMELPADKKPWIQKAQQEIQDLYHAIYT